MAVAIAFSLTLETSFFNQEGNHINQKDKSKSSEIIFFHSYLLSPCKYWYIYLVFGIIFYIIEDIIRIYNKSWLRYFEIGLSQI